MENTNTTPTTPSMPPTPTSTTTIPTPTTATTATGENAITTGGLVSRETIDNLAFWLGSTVSAAFFSSLDRFSCVNITTDDVDDDDDEADDFSVAPSNSSSSSVTVDGDPNSNDAAKIPV